MSAADQAALAMLRARYADLVVINLGSSGCGCPRGQDPEARECRRRDQAMAVGDRAMKRVFAVKATFAESDAPKAALARLRALWIVLASARLPGCCSRQSSVCGPCCFRSLLSWWACYGAVELCIQVKVLQPWRPLTMAVLGLFALSVTMFGSVDVTALAAGVTDSWQLTFAVDLACAA
ncbi:hypothetical protein [Kibdelosporangium philippinense]|uniref:hypothetical protein n=1 Tax=Kibdelosporangium philippinense TaxID=211113 RepID=UPI00362291B9